MKVKVEKEGDVIVVFVEGDVDAVTCDELQQRIDQVINGQGTKLILDLAGVNYISSAGLRVILATAKRLYTDGLFAVSRPRDSVMEILDMVGLASVVKIYGDLEEAKKEMLS